MHAQNETHIHCRSGLDHILMNKNVNNFVILLASKINDDKVVSNVSSQRDSIVLASLMAHES